MGDGFLGVSYMDKEQKGVGQLDNTALIKNICRFCGGGRKKNSEGWERSILLHLFVSTGFSLCLAAFSALSRLRLS